MLAAVIWIGMSLDPLTADLETLASKPCLNAGFSLKIVVLQSLVPHPDHCAAIDHLSYPQAPCKASCSPLPVILQLMCCHGVHILEAGRRGRYRFWDDLHRFASPKKVAG